MPGRDLANRGAGAGRPTGRPQRRGGRGDRAAGGCRQRRRIAAGRVVAGPGGGDRPTAGPARGAARGPAPGAGRRPAAGRRGGRPRGGGRPRRGGAPLRVGEVVAVVGGAAGDVPAPDGVGVVRAPGGGDDALAASAAELVAAGPLLVVTADRGLRARLPAGAAVAGPGWLLGQLDEKDQLRPI